MSVFKGSTAKVKQIALVQDDDNRFTCRESLGSKLWPRELFLYRSSSTQNTVLYSWCCNNIIMTLRDRYTKVCCDKVIKQLFAKFSSEKMHWFCHWNLCYRLRNVYKCTYMHVDIRIYIYGLYLYSCNYCLFMHPIMWFSESLDIIYPAVQSAFKTIFAVLKRGLTWK